MYKWCILNHKVIFVVPKVLYYVESYKKLPVSQVFIFSFLKNCKMSYGFSCHTWMFRWLRQSNARAQ